MPRLSQETEHALYLCGSDRVFHNDGTPPSVAIRRTPFHSLPGDKWLTASGETHDEAGRKAASAFADELQREADRIAKQAQEIRASLGRAAAESGGGHG